MKKIVIFSRNGKPNDYLLEQLKMCFPGCKVDCIFAEPGDAESGDASVLKRRKAGGRAKSGSSEQQPRPSDL